MEANFCHAKMYFSVFIGKNLKISLFCVTKGHQVPYSWTF